MRAQPTKIFSSLLLSFVVYRATMQSRNSLKLLDMANHPPLSLAIDKIKSYNKYLQ